MLWVGLMNWIGNAPPKTDDLAGHVTVAQAQIHLRAILQTGPTIDGHRPLEHESIEPDAVLSESPGANCYLMRGYDRIRIATAQEQRQLETSVTWGYLIIRRKAEELSLAKRAV